MLKLDSRQNKPLSSVRFVTHKGNSMKVSITAKRGVTGYRMMLHHGIGDRPWTPNRLKTTKFIQSKPVVKFKGEPPF